MGRRGGIVALVGAVAVVLLLWVSSAASEHVFRTPDLTFSINLPQAGRDRPEAPEIGGDRALRPGQYRSVPWYENPNVLATYAFTLLIAAGFGTGLVGGLREYLRYRRLKTLRDERWQRDIVPEMLGEHVRAGQERLQQGTARNAIVAVWAALEDGAAAAGLEPKPTETAQEFTQRAFFPWLPDTAPLTELAAMYRRARFSRHATVSESDRSRAGELLAEVLSQLEAHAREVSGAR